MLYFVIILFLISFFVNYFLYNFILLKISGLVLVRDNVSLLIAEIFEPWVLDCAIEIQSFLTTATVEEWVKVLEVVTFLGLVKRSHEEFVSMQIILLEEILCNHPDLCWLLVYEYLSQQWDLIDAHRSFRRSSYQGSSII